MSVVAFRREIVAETTAGTAELREWVGERIQEHLVGHPDAEDAVVGNLPDARLAPDLIAETRARLAALARLRER